MGRIGSEGGAGGNKGMRKVATVWVERLQG